MVNFMKGVYNKWRQNVKGLNRTLSGRPCTSHKFVTEISYYGKGPSLADKTSLLGFDNIYKPTDKISLGNWPNQNFFFDLSRPE